MARMRELPSHLQNRAFSVAEAARAGIKPSGLRSNELATPFRGVRTHGGPSELPDLCAAYLAHDPDAIFCHLTAARLWGLPLPRRLERDPRLHVLDDLGVRGARGVGVSGHKSGRGVPVRMREGLRLTSPVATWLSLANTLALDDLIVAGDRLLDWKEPLAGIHELAINIAAATGMRGIRKARAARDEIRPNAHSARETRTRLAIVRAGLPEPALNAKVELPSGYTLHGDLVYRAPRVLLEYESEAHRLDAEQWARDLLRYNELSAAGWIVVRIAKGHTPSAIVASVRRALHARLPLADSRGDAFCTTSPRG